MEDLLNGSTRSPPKPEQADWYAESAYESRWKPLLWCNLTILIELRFLHEVEVEKKWWDDG